MYGNQGASVDSQRVRQHGNVPGDDVRPSGNVESQLRHSDELLAGAHARIDALISRLNPVSRPAPPAGEPRGGTGTAGQIGSPLAEKLRGQNIALEVLLDKINAAVDAIDL